MGDAVDNKTCLLTIGDDSFAGDRRGGDLSDTLVVWEAGVMSDSMAGWRDSVAVVVLEEGKEDRSGGWVPASALRMWMVLWLARAGCCVDGRGE